MKKRFIYSLLMLTVLHITAFAASRPPTSIFRIYAQSGTVSNKEGEYWKQKFAAEGCRYILETRFDDYSSIACVEVYVGE